MTKLEKHAIQHALKERASPSVPGNTYDFAAKGGKVVQSSQLVKGKHNVELLESEEFKAGYLHAHQQIAEIITFIMTAKPSDLRRFAGKPKGGA